jgi:hypothetical protein
MSTPSNSHTPQRSMQTEQAPRGRLFPQDLGHSQRHANLTSAMATRVHDAHIACVWRVACMKTWGTEPWHADAIHAGPAIFRRTEAYICVMPAQRSNIATHVMSQRQTVKSVQQAWRIFEEYWIAEVVMSCCTRGRYGDGGCIGPASTRLEIFGDNAFAAKLTSGDCCISRPAWYA